MALKELRHKRYIESFPNAKQENLFIGMLHSFENLGVLTSFLRITRRVVIDRDEDENQIWQKDYEVFMDTVGFKTKFCQPRHPFTKGKVERLLLMFHDQVISKSVVVINRNYHRSSYI